MRPYALAAAGQDTVIDGAILSTLNPAGNRPVIAITSPGATGGGRPRKVTRAGVQGHRLGTASPAAAEPSDGRGDHVRNGS